MAGSREGQSTWNEDEATPLISSRTSSYNSGTSSTLDSDSTPNDPSLKKTARAQIPTGSALTSFWRKREDQVNLEDIATQPSVFDNEDLVEYFQPSPQYENLHRFDPSERWTWAEELSLVRKLDWKVTMWACVAFFALDLPRSNIKQANTDNFLDDLGLNTNDYNLGNSLFRVTFLLAELPSQLISKRLGADVWIPAQMIMWSFVSASQFWLKGRTSFLFCRLLIGFLQGGFIPDLILYLSYFFTSKELPLRLALFWISNRMTEIASPLIAFVLLHLRGVNGHEGWRWLFLIEGLLTFLIGVWSVFCMVPGITQTAAKWRPNGWFTEREEKIAVNRILRDDPSKGDMHNREGISLKSLWRTLCDFDLWPLYIIGLTFGIPPGPSEQYLTLTLRNLGFGTFSSNLLSIPGSMGTTIMMLTGTYLAERLDQRAYFGVIAQLWMLPCIIALRCLPADVNRWIRYGLVTTIISYPYPHPVQVAWCSRISNSVSTRTVSAALYNMAVQLQYIVSANIYREDDKPLYRRGNMQLSYIVGMNIVIYLLAKLYYVRRNKAKRKQWDALSPKEQKAYMKNSRESGSRRLDFEFVS